MGAHSPCLLTEAFDEADDTGPAPLSWHLHGVDSQRANRMQTENNQTKKKKKSWEGSRNVTLAGVVVQITRWMKCLQ